MINKYNIAELSLVDRPVGGTSTGFGSVINRFNQNHDQRHFNTTFNDFHGQAPRVSAAATVEEIQAEYSKQAGGNARTIDQQKVKTVSCLTGEHFSRDPLARTKRDPQENTDVQRSWLYSKDAAVTAAKEQPAIGAASQVQFFDNQLSLPLGDGVWATKPKSDQPGFFRHIRTDVTIQKNTLITRK